MLQQGATSEDKGVDIRGDTLELTHKLEGDLLVVSGDLAWLQMDKLLIVGSTVNIDQAANRAWVNGIGAMRIDSTDNDALGGVKKDEKKAHFKITDKSFLSLRRASVPDTVLLKLNPLKDRGFETRDQFAAELARAWTKAELDQYGGHALDAARQDQPAPTTFHWNGHMVFDGREAAFYKDVQAIQDKKSDDADPPVSREIKRLLCQSLQVYLDRTVSLKPGDKGAAPAKVRNLVCNKDVRLEEGEWLLGRLVKLQRIEAPEVSLDNEAGTLVAAGPGMVRLYQLGSTDPLGGGEPTGRAGGVNPRMPAPKPNAAEMKLTSVKYSQRLRADNQKHIADFYGEVEAVNLPTNNPDMRIDLDNLPEGGMYVHADRFKVYERPENGVSNQQMEARGENGKEAYVKGRDFAGQAPLDHPS